MGLDCLSSDEQFVANAPVGSALCHECEDFALAGAQACERIVCVALVQEFVQSEGAKLGSVNQALRVAVTGKDKGFGTYETLALLGREHCLARIDRALARL